ncbi:hypothetical protein KEM55_001197 [Ascosphaera atra]|nr:hypothetical protein KEM55_001197 [Ascosphaera atra]
MHELEALVQTKDAEIEQLKGSSSANDDESRASGAAAAAAVANARAHSDGFAASNANTIQPAPVLRLPTEASPFQGPSSTKSFLCILIASKGSAGA